MANRGGNSPATGWSCPEISAKPPWKPGFEVWVSGGKLAAAVSHAGGLGLIGAGSMQAELLHRHIIKAQSLTARPIGVNIPLLYEKAHEQIDKALFLGVKIFFTSAGSPKKFTSYLKDHGAIVVHVISTPIQAIKCEEAGVDAVVAEGFLAALSATAACGSCISPPSESLPDEGRLEAAEALCDKDNVTCAPSGTRCSFICTPRGIKFLMASTSLVSRFCTLIILPPCLLESSFFLAASSIFCISSESLFKFFMPALLTG